MTDTLEYRLELGVSDNADVDGIEDFLQQLLLDLYEQGQIESIKVVKDGHTSSVSSDDMPELIDTIEGVATEDLKKAIDSVRVLEQSGDGDDE